MTKSDRQHRWYQKLKACPERLAEFQAKTRAAAKAYFHGGKTDAERLERIRAARRRAARVQWAKNKNNPEKLAKLRAWSLKRCTMLEDAYVLERLKLTPEACPRELLELKRAHLQLQRELRNRKNKCNH